MIEENSVSIDYKYKIKAFLMNKYNILTAFNRFNYNYQKKMKKFKKLFKI